MHGNSQKWYVTNYIVIITHTVATTYVYLLMMYTQTGGANGAALLNTIESFALLLANGINDTEKVIKRDNIGLWLSIL